MDGKDQGSVLKLQAPGGGQFCMGSYCFMCEGLKRWAMLTGVGIGWMMVQR